MPVRRAGAPASRARRRARPCSRGSEPRTSPWRNDTARRARRRSAAQPPSVRRSSVAPARDVRLVALEIAGRDDAAAPGACEQRLDDVERDVRDHERPATGSSSASASAARASISTPFARAFSPCDLDGVGIDVDGDDRREAELRGGDREHAGAAADVEQARRRGSSWSSSRRQPRRRVRAGAERTARDRSRPRVDAGGRLLPRRADPEAADDDAVVELAPARPPSPRRRHRRR